jgi:hypothetical protein
MKGYRKVRVPPGGITVELTAGLAGQQPSSILTCAAPSSLTGCVPVFTRSNRPSACTSNGTFPRSTVVAFAVRAPVEAGADVAVGDVTGVAVEHALSTSPESATATIAGRLIRLGTRMVPARTVKLRVDPGDTRAGGRFLHQGVVSQASLSLPELRD